MADVIGWVAAGLTLLTFSMRTMLPLRLSAVGANVFFILYGWQAGLTPVFALHCVLLPFNLFRLGELLIVRRRFTEARSGVHRTDWLKGLGKTLRLSRGEIIFNKGDPADKLYQVTQGTVELVEIGVTLDEGEIFGEIAFFTAAQARTLTASCKTDCELVAVEESDFMAIHYQDPSFGVYLTQLIASRLLDGMSTSPGAYARPDARNAPRN